MKSIYRDKMTNDMKVICDSIQEELQKECLYCLSKIKQCNNAIVKLPHTNEEGVSVVWKIGYG